MCRKTWLSILVVLIFGVAACLPSPFQQPPPVSPSPLPPSTTPTPTVVWFPPTPTFTPLPPPAQSITPTLDVRPAYGNLIFMDDFSQPENWSLGKSPQGVIAMGKNELSLGILQTGGYIFSLRKAPLLSDFYLEISASPSICRHADEYGLLLRVSAALDFFRFGLNCQGEARLDRVLGGKASSLHPPLPDGAIPPGAPSSSRLAVFARGKELRFFVNDVYLFTVRDASLLSGSLGVYARLSQGASMTVNFSQLEVYETLP